jgi:hypothetical protein
MCGVGDVYVAVKGVEPPPTWEEGYVQHAGEGLGGRVSDMTMCQHGRTRGVVFHGGGVRSNCG